MNTSEKPKNIHAQLLGSAGGKQRAKNLTEKQLRSIAKKGAKARWGKKKVVDN